MTTIGEQARVRLTLDTDRHITMEGVTATSPLADQAMYVWYSAHARIKNGEHTEQGHGVVGTLNMARLVRELFTLSTEQATQLSGLIRQVLKASGAARCISVGHRETQPVWWVADTMPDNIIPIAVAIANKTARGESTMDGAPKPYRPSLREDRLTPAEAGETREPAPVTVIKPEPAPEPEPEPEPEPNSELLGNYTAPRNENILKVRRVLEAFSPLGAREIQSLIKHVLVPDRPDEWIHVTTVRAALANMPEVVSRLEHPAERAFRSTVVNPRMSGKDMRLYALDSAALTDTRTFGVRLDTGEIVEGQAALKDVGVFESRRSGDKRPAAPTATTVDTVTLPADGEDPGDTVNIVDVVEPEPEPEPEPEQPAGSIESITHAITALVAARDIEITELRRELAELQSRYDAARAALDAVATTLEVVVSSLRAD